MTSAVQLDLVVDDLLNKETFSATHQARNEHVWREDQIDRLDYA